MLHVDDKSLCFIACESGKHGEDCLEDCGNCKSGDVCSGVTGHCPDGCQAGWWMETCKVGKSIFKILMQTKFSNFKCHECIIYTWCVYGKKTTY